MKLTALSFDLNETRSSGNDGNVFQIIPRFALEPESKNPVSEDEYISFSMGGNTEIGLAVGRELLLIEMKNETVTQRREFDAPIDFVQWSKSLLVVGLRNSLLVFLNPTTLEPLDERLTDDNLDAGKDHNGKYFCGGYISVDHVNSVCEVLAINTQGRVSLFRTSMAPDNTLDYTRLEQSTFINDGRITELTAAINSYRSVVCSTFVGSKFIVTVEDHGLICISELLISGESDRTLALQNTLSGSETFDTREDATGVYKTLCSSNLLGDLGLTYRDASIVKIKRCEGLVFALLSSGHLEILLDEELFPTQRLKLPNDSCKIYDFTVVLREQDIDIWVAFGSSGVGGEEMSVGVYKGPSYNPKFIIKVPQAYFILSSEEDRRNSLDTNGLGIKFDQKATIHDEPTALIQTSSSGIRVFQFLESSTDATLQRLVSQGKFDQANELALKYSIHTDIVNKARVTSYYNTFPTQTNDKILQRTFSTIVITLESISDVDFICKFCTCDTNTLLPKIEWVKQMLQFGFKRAATVAGTVHGKNLLQLMKKFYTFECVMPGATVRDWKEFCHESTSMLIWCKQFLENGRLVDCNTVWTRHSEEFLPNMTEAEIAPYIWSLYSLRLASPESIVLYTSILNDAIEIVIPSPSDDDKKTVDKVKVINARQELLGLVKKQVLFMEQEHNWPSPAVKFVKTLITVFAGEENKYDAMIRNERLAEVTWLTKREFCEDMKLCLMHMLQSLQDLGELIQAHSMRVSFLKFVQDDLYEVVNAMLDELFVREEIYDFVEGFLKTFAKSKNLCTDKLYASHIQSIMEKLTYFANALSIPYEERLICLVGLTEDLEIKLHSILEMSRHWPVPWSEGMENLVNKTLRLRIDDYDDDEKGGRCRALLLQITAVKRQVPFQCLLYKYRLTASKLDLDFNVWMALKRIISLKKPDYLEDCMQLIKYSGCYTETDVMVLKYSMDLRAFGMEKVLEELAKDNPHKDVLKSFAAKCLNVVLRPRCQMAPEMFEAHVKLAQILNNRLDEPTENDLILLRKLVPTLNKISIIHSEMYPFVIIEMVLPMLVAMDYSDAYRWCSTLAEISFTSISDIVLALLFSVDRFAERMKGKAWEFIRSVVTTPTRVRSPEVADVVMSGLGDLLSQNPNLTYENQILLREFLEFLLRSFTKYSQELSGFWSLQQLFISMREQEIPLESNLVTIIKGVTGVEPMRVESLFEALKSIGTILIEYGEIDMVVSILNTVILNYHALKENEGAAEVCNDIIDQLLQLMQELTHQFNAAVDKEDDPHVINLVQGLREVKITVNAFALRRRNKTKLIDLLLEKNNFLLASEVALVFHHRDERQWSTILSGFLRSEIRMDQLISLLRRLRKITELWVLPEFAQAWSKVSLHSPELAHLCPIPLE